MRRPDRDQMTDDVAGEYDGAAAALFVAARLLVAVDVASIEGHEAVCASIVVKMLERADVFAGRRPTRCTPEDDFFRDWMAELERIREAGK